MNSMFWGIFVMAIIVTLTCAAPRGEAQFRGNCEIDADCMEGYVCMAPGFGKASDKAQKKCYPDGDGSTTSTTTAATTSTTAATTSATTSATTAATASTTAAISTTTAATTTTFRPS